MTMYSFESCSRADYESVAKVLLRAPHIEPISFLQAPLYGRIQEASGKHVSYFAIHKDGELYGGGLAVAYTAPGGLSFLYCPYGPTAADIDSDLYNGLRKFLQPIAKDVGCAFVRVDSDMFAAQAFVRPVSNRVARTASLQPRAEWILDIQPDEETLWMGFHKHARYNIRLAERANASIEFFEPSKAPLDMFYSLMQTTANRDAFSLYNRNQYESFLQNLSADEGFVVIASIDGTPAAAGLFVVYDKQAHYVFAGSSNDFRKIAPAYSVLWHAIREAKSRGCTQFNFGGISDEVKSQSLGGVTDFKKRFGGHTVIHPNPVDIVYKPLIYALFKFYKTLR